MRTEFGDSDWFTIGQGVHQGCILSPCLFNVYAEYMQKAFDGYSDAVSIGGRPLTSLSYADNTTLIARTASDFQALINQVKESSEEHRLYLNVKKTKVMICGGNADQPVKADGKDIEVLYTFNFLGSLIVDEDGSSQEMSGYGKNICYFTYRPLEGQKNL